MPSPNRRRSPDYLQQGQHPPLVSLELFERCQHVRRGKGHAPQRQRQPAHVYLLSGLARCWPCYQATGLVRWLRGSSSNHGQHYYRCSTRVEYYAAPASDLTPARLTPQPSPEALPPCPLRTRRAEELEAQVVARLWPLRIPLEWQDDIVSYYASDDGHLELERHRHNLAEVMRRAVDHYALGLLTRAEFERERVSFADQLARLRPSQRPEAHTVRPWLNDFASLWPQLTPSEQRGFLRQFIAVLYVDGSTLHTLTWNEPFDRWLPPALTPAPISL